MLCFFILCVEKKITEHSKCIPEYSYSAHHNGCSLLVETHGDVLNIWWVNPVPCTCCDPYSPLTTGMLVLCDELYGTSSTLGDWGCVLKLKFKSIRLCTLRLIFCQKTNSKPSPNHSWFQWRFGEICKWLHNCTLIPEVHPTFRRKGLKSWAFMYYIKIFSQSGTFWIWAPHVCQVNDFIVYCKTQPTYKINVSLPD